MTSPSEVTEAQEQINAARAQTHANISVSQAWAALAEAAAEASGTTSAQSALIDANRAEQAKAHALVSRTEAETARQGAEAARNVTVTARAGVDTAVAALKAEILGGVGPAFDTLAELKTAYESSDQSLTTLIGGKAEKTDPRFTDTRDPKTHRHVWGDIDAKPAEFTPATHKHPVTGIEATGSPSNSTYLRGDGMWASPPYSTFSGMQAHDAEAGVSLIDRVISPGILKGAILFFAQKKDWQGTQAQYDALATKDADRTYWIV